MNTSEIIEICRQLDSEGKTPSVALIKARLIKPVPLPIVIAGLKQWQANPKAKSGPAPQFQAENSNSLEQRVNELEQQVADLHRQLKAVLKAQNPDN